MKLSFLIPTHNRPKLFNRCLTAILDQLTPDMEVIVNNDSNDIEEIDHPQVNYHYNKFEHLSHVYRFLLEQSKGEYVYYSEDDDYVVKDFTSIPLDADLIAGNFYPTYQKDIQIIKCMTLYSDSVYDDPKKFVEYTNLYYLQLSQYIFKKETVKDFEFRDDSDIHNDIRLLLHAAKKSQKLKTMNKVFFYQTIDGLDNISFDALPETL